MPQVDQHGVNKAVSSNEEAELADFQGRTKWPVVFSVFFFFFFFFQCQFKFIVA